MTTTGFFETVESRFHDWKYGHPRVLHALIRSLKPSVVVEVGSYRGYCACYLARALQENNAGKLYCIDNWSLTEHVERYGNPRAHFEANLVACGVRDWVEIIEGDSDKVTWPEKIQFCYVDGNHSYQMAKHDFNKAASHGATLIAIDDTENCVGPRAFVDGVWDSEWERIHLHSDNGLDIFTRRAPKRLITFSQELPFPNPGVDLRPLTLEQQAEHFSQASKITGLDYTGISGKTVHS